MEMIINDFSGKYRFLSNFWMAQIIVGGRRWASAEHCYQAAKSLLICDWNAIQGCRTPGEAKRMGQKISLRLDWETIKLPVMEDIVRAKFDQHVDLRNKLLATGSAKLVEQNSWGDTFWGVCGNTGHNHLGKILMKIRGDYQ